jgi:hypothetical protein
MMIDPLPHLGDSESSRHGYPRLWPATLSRPGTGAYERAARLYLTDHIKLAEGRG